MCSCVFVRPADVVHPAKLFGALAAAVSVLDDAPLDCEDFPDWFRTITLAIPDWQRRSDRPTDRPNVWRENEKLKLILFSTQWANFAAAANIAECGELGSTSTAAGWLLLLPPATIAHVESRCLVFFFFLRHCVFQIESAHHWPLCYTQTWRVCVFGRCR